MNLIHKKIPRMDIPVDIEATYFDSDTNDSKSNSNIPIAQQNLRSAKDNKKLYLESYAIKFRIPVCYVIDSVIYSQDPQYVV